MSIQQLSKSILSINIKSTKKDIQQAVLDSQKLAKLELLKISNANKKSYSSNIELSRLKHKISNSKQAIKKHWNNRKSKKLLILKHIKTIRKQYKLIN